MKDGTCYKVKVSGTPAVDVRKLKDSFVDLVCTEVTDKRPEFALAPKYYILAAAPTPAVPALTRPPQGGQTGLVESQTLELKSSLILNLFDGC